MDRKVKRYRPQLLLSAGLVALSAGTAHSGDSGPFDEDRWRGDRVTVEAGNAAAHNIAVQTIDPSPRYVDDSRINVDGQRLLIAAGRYKANESIPPRSLSTQAAGAPPNNAAR